jgi:hypothetical protein
MNHGRQSTRPEGIRAIVSLRVLKPGRFVLFQGTTCFAGKSMAGQPEFSPKTWLLCARPWARKSVWFEAGIGVECA